MKIWIKLILGSVLGGLLGLYLPEYGGDTGELLAFLSTLVLNISRYVLFPLCFFGLCVAAFELRRERRFMALVSRLVPALAAVTAGLIAIGMVAMTAFSPTRVPIVVGRHAPVARPEAGLLLLQVFPDNVPLVFFQNGNFLLPLVVFALLLGTSLALDKQTARPVLDLFDALNRVFYLINSLVTELFGFAAMVLTAALVFQGRFVTEMELFFELLFVMVVTTLIVILVVFPALLYWLGGKRINPAAWLYAQIAPAVYAFLSGDSYAVLGLLLRHGREDMGIPRRIGAPIFSLLGIFSRGGTAMITAMGFVMVLRSYSSLDITFFQIVWIVAALFLTSFTLGAFPAKALPVSLAVVAALYGRGMEQGYLILMPAVFIFNRLGVMLDTVASSFVATITAESFGDRRTIEPAKFI